MLARLAARVGLRRMLDPSFATSCLIQAPECRCPDHPNRQLGGWVKLRAMFNEEWKSAGLRIPPWLCSLIAHKLKMNVLVSGIVVIRSSDFPGFQNSLWRRSAYSEETPRLILVFCRDSLGAGQFIRQGSIQRRFGRFQSRSEGLAQPAHRPPT